MARILIIGSSGHAKVIIDILERAGEHAIIGLTDPNRNPGEQTLGYPVLGHHRDLPQLVESRQITGALVAVGDNYTRSTLANIARTLCPALPFITAVHPNTSIARDVSIGEGTVIMAGVTVNPCCSIGAFCILNSNSSLDHDSSMESYSSLAPCVATGGNCRIGPCAAVGIGAVLVHGVEIGAHTVIGAGSTVLTHVDSFKVAYGTPARIVRHRQPADSYL